MQFSLKTMEHCLLFLILLFQVSLLISLCRGLDYLSKDERKSQLEFKLAYSDVAV